MAQSTDPRPLKKYQYNEKGLPIMTVPVPMPPVKPPRKKPKQLSTVQQQQTQQSVQYGK